MRLESGFGGAKPQVTALKKNQIPVNMNGKKIIVRII